MPARGLVKRYPPSQPEEQQAPSLPAGKMEANSKTTNQMGGRQPPSQPRAQLLVSAHPTRGADAGSRPRAAGSKSVRGLVGRHPPEKHTSYWEGKLAYWKKTNVTTEEGGITPVITRGVSDTPEGNPTMTALSKPQLGSVGRDMTRSCTRSWLPPSMRERMQWMSTYDKA